MPEQGPSGNRRRYVIDAGDGIEVHACADGMDERARATRWSLWARAAMGDGGPCMSCGGNDGYGPPPHHDPECYFASFEDSDAR